MYVTTFYSFKGGVGRTMAMVNCAFELAKNGKRILMVDFDLEAPGIDAFLHPYGARKSKGLVDFVTDYRSTRVAPDVVDYVYEAGPPGARLHVMPAGKRDDSYASRLNNIDWGQLYEKEDGYLLIEDLKAQWEEKLSPDYVFIDSRTGHTDVSGICTRQLPDSVVLLYRLDPQNLEGLQPMVNAIRSEASGPRKKKIHLQFVPSNVPDMDDEDEILEKQIRNFRDRLHPDDEGPMIKHYGDLEMLEHKVFTIERKNSRLSKEYRQLVDSVIRMNPEDLAGAKDFLRLILKPSHTRTKTLSDRGTHVDAIADKHRSDPEVLRLLARLREQQGRIREAIAFTTDAIAAGPTTSRSYTRRAELYAIVGEELAVEADLRTALASKAEDYYSVSRLVSLIQEIVPDLLAEVPESRALKSLSPAMRVRLAESVVSEAGSIDTAVIVLKQVIDDAEADGDSVREAKRALSLPLIEKNSFTEVVDLLGNPESIEEAFNYAMAMWGKSGNVPIASFERVREIDETNGPRERDANYEFCMALTAWALSNDEQASEALSASLERLRHRSVTFSPWRYQWIGPDQFQTDLNEAKKMLEGGQVLPAVFRHAPWYGEVANA